MSDYFLRRDWMDNRLDPFTNTVTEDFANGINVFIQFASLQESYQQTGTFLCPCARCKNEKQQSAKVVSRHLFLKGFKGNYYVWSSHGETFYHSGESSTSMPMQPGVDPWGTEGFTSHPHFEPHTNVQGGYMPEDTNVNYMHEDVPAAMAHIEPDMAYGEICEDEAYKSFVEANQPLYEGCRKDISQLYLASRILRWKTEYNLAEACVDDIAKTIKDVLPQPNKAPPSYYETKKLTKALGLPVHKIDVCEDNCMLFWKEADVGLEQCRYCGKDRYHPWNGKGKKIPKRRMFYLPIADRLKRLYQCESTAHHMRWHAEHISPLGEMHHPSDGAVWKHFRNTYPSFAAVNRNEYL